MNQKNIKKISVLFVTVLLFFLSLFSIFANEIYFATSITTFYFCNYTNIYSLCLNNLQLNKVNNITHNLVLNYSYANITNCPSLIFVNNKQQANIITENAIHFTYHGITGNNITVTLLLNTKYLSQQSQNAFASYLTNTNYSLELCNASQCWNITSFYVFNKNTPYPGLSTVWSNLFLPNESLPWISFVIPNAVNQTIYTLKFVQLNRKNYTISNFISVSNATLPSGRHSLSCAPFGDSIYCFGGYDGSYLNQIVRYNVTSNTVTVMSATLPFGRQWLSCAPFGDSIYCFGGDASSGLTNQIVRYNVTSNTVTVMSATLPSGRQWLSCAPFGDSIFCFGGYDNSYINQIVRYGSYFLNQKVFEYHNTVTQFNITNENLALQTANLTITYQDNSITTLTNVQTTTQSNVKRIQINPSTSSFVSKLYNFDNFKIISNVFYLMLQEINRGLYYSFYVQDLNQQPIESTTIIVLKRIASLNMYYPIFVTRTQVDGSASFFLYPNDEYVFYIHALNHEDKMFSLITDPNIRTIFIRLNPLGTSSDSTTVSVAQIDYLSFFKNLTFNLTPDTYYLNANSTTINFYVSDATNKLKLTRLQIYRVNLTNKTMIANLNSTNTSIVNLNYNIQNTGKYEVQACIQKELTTTEQQIFAVNEYCIKRDYFLYIQEQINFSNIVSEKGYLLLAIIVTLLVMGFIAKFTVVGAGWVGLGVFGLFALFNNTALLTSIWIFSALALVAITFLKQYW